MTVDDTDYPIIGAFNTIPAIPEGVLAVSYTHLEAPADSAAVDSTAAPVMAQATSTADSLAAALKGENKAQTVDLAQIKKEHPLLAFLQVNSSGQGPVVAYANYKDTAEINKYLSMREIQDVYKRQIFGFILIMYWRKKDRGNGYYYNLS